jgi:hypothetical protein
MASNARPDRFTTPTIPTYLDEIPTHSPVEPGLPTRDLSDHGIPKNPSRTRRVDPTRGTRPGIQRTRRRENSIEKLVSRDVSCNVLHIIDDFEN